MENYEEYEEISSKSDSEIHEEAISNYNKAMSVWSEIREDYKADVSFSLLGKQWDEDTVSKRTMLNRTSLTYNILDQMIKYIVNQAKASKPSIKVHPIKDSDKETARIIDGIIKNILNRSDASDAFSNAYQCAVAGGYGAFRVVPEELEDGEIEISVERILDPLSIIIDPNAKKSDFSDAKYAFITSVISKDEFKKKYPEFECDNFGSNTSWGDKDTVQVAEYWIKEDDKVSQYIINGSDILYKNEEYKGEYIPLCIVVGEEVVLESERKFKSLIRESKDMQKLLNYSKSEAADHMSKIKKAQWLTSVEALGADLEHQRQWETASTENYDTMFWSGKGTPPQLIPSPAMPSVYVDIAKVSQDDIKIQTGVLNPYEDIPAMASGKAIAQQIAQKNVQSYGFVDNLNKAIKYCGVILVDLIQKYMSNPNEVQIENEDGSIKSVRVNQPYMKGRSWKNHNLGEGKYMVTLSTGPSYESQRAETSEKLLELVKVLPMLSQVGADIIVKNLDFEGADILADRIRASLPPNLQAITGEEEQDKAMMMSALSESQARLNEMSRMMEMMSAKLNEQNAMIAELESKQRHELNMAQLDAQTQLNKSAMEGENKLELEKLRTISTQAKVNKENNTKLELQQNSDLAKVRQELLKNSATLRII